MNSGFSCVGLQVLSCSLKEFNVTFVFTVQVPATGNHWSYPSKRIRISSQSKQKSLAMVGVLCAEACERSSGADSQVGRR